MTDEATPVEPVADPVVEVVEVAAPPKPDFGEHPVFASMVAHVEQFAGAATARVEQLLTELRQLMNEHGL